MKKTVSFILFLVLVIAAFSCKKDDTTPNTNNNNNNNNTANCADGSVCFKLDGTQVSKPGAGYVWSDTSIFIKYEEGSKQLSIDIFGKAVKSYTVGDKRLVNNARIYYFPEPNKQYMSASGSLAISEFSNDNKVTGTFSAKLYKYNSDNSTFDYKDSMTITDGYFTKVQLVK
jgi:hypothetical protein